MSLGGVTDSLKVRELEAKVNKLESKLNEVETKHESHKINTDELKTVNVEKGVVPGTISTIKGLGLGGAATGVTAIGVTLAVAKITGQSNAEGGWGTIVEAGVFGTTAGLVGAAAGAIVPHITQDYGKGAIIGSIGGGVAGAVGLGLTMKNLPAAGMGFVVGALAGAMGSEIGILANK
jgi:hypothetical protein